MKLVRLFAAIFFVVTCSVVSAADDASVAKFKALEEEWSNAIKAQDRAKLEEFLRPEYTLTVARAGQLAHTDRASWLQNATTVYVLHEFRFDELMVREYGHVAVVSSRYFQKATVAGRDRSGDAFLTDIWVKTGDRWQVSARYSSRPDPFNAPTATTPAPQ
jgi:ketosteroid isomerase-like protein